MKRTALLAILLALTTSQADAFSSPGHQAIGDVAQDRLSPGTRAALGQILQGSNDLAPGALATVATWPDDVRARAAHGTIAAGWTADDVQEADDFNRDHPRNGEWHFVNLPLGAAGYPADPVAPGDPLRAFVGPDDIVHALNQAIQILESPTDTPGFSKRQAVRFIVHLVGDITRSRESGLKGPVGRWPARDTCASATPRKNISPRRSISGPWTTAFLRATIFPTSSRV